MKMKKFGPKRGMPPWHPFGSATRMTFKHTDPTLVSNTISVVKIFTFRPQLLSYKSYHVMRVVGKIENCRKL